MKKSAIIVFILLWGMLLYGSKASTPALQKGVLLQADGQAIDIKVGHLVPCVTDWNNDGKKDLVVGQFSGGKIRLYLNCGSDKQPKFKGFSFLSAGGQEISLPAG
ncbi:hypothetical protein ACFL54_02065 [Planctomycetota bacterium]